MPEDDRDPDRRAILSRRQRLIAIALSGLGTTAGGCDAVSPAPCLEAMPIERPLEPPTGGPMLPETDELPAHPPPMPCLEPTPRDAVDEGEPADDRQEETAPEQAQPHPCLSRPRPPPMPCLTPRRVEPQPMPCLSESRVDRREDPE
jgi:hypothetical protein